MKCLICNLRLTSRVQVREITLSMLSFRVGPGFCQGEWNVSITQVIYMKHQNYAVLSDLRKNEHLTIWFPNFYNYISYRFCLNSYIHTTLKWWTVYNICWIYIYICPPPLKVGSKCTLKKDKNCCDLYFNTSLHFCHRLTHHHVEDITVNLRS